jgi:signal transduction histidine kinase
VPPGLSFLLVAPDDRSEAAMREAIPEAAWTQCPSIDAAEAYLAAAAFDAVVVDEALAKDPTSGAPALRRRFGVAVHVLRSGDPSSLRRALEGGADGAEGLLEDVRLALGRAIHDVNNPMTVITGNAQYALELARGLDLDPSLVRSLEDIEEAGQRLESSMAALSVLRQRLVGIEGGDRLGGDDVRR